jgi:putative integral membrane protein (TIGR02587 family)
MPADAPAEPGRALLIGLGRAAGGALIFGLPMLMTNELWQFGAAMDRLRLALLLVLAVPLLVGVAHRIGFEATFGWQDDLRDACIALGIGMLAAGAILGLFNLLAPDLSADAMIGRVAVQAVPTALGAMLARSQFGGDRPPEEREAFSGYGGTLFMMVVGALFLGLNVAPTEEMVEIAYMMTPWHALGLVLVTVGAMHAFVYGHGTGDGRAPWWSLMLRFTLVGYVVALAISLYVLWTFGRIDGVGAAPLLMSVVVLAFPAGLGAAAARLVL